MDRWADADDDISGKPKPAQHGRVATLGLKGFVKSAGTGATAAQTFGEIEIRQSKKEQEATILMPPPPPKLLASQPPPQSTANMHHASSNPHQQPPAPGVAATTPRYHPPPWATDPTPGACFEVMKDGVVIQEVPLIKVATVFGRQGDVPLDHPSVSRQHAAVCFERTTGKCNVIDLGSAHGTFVEGRQLVKDQPTEIKQGQQLRFAASSRVYVFSIKQHSPRDGRPEKRSRVSGPADTNTPGISHSDSGDIDVSGSTTTASGQFAGVVQSTIVPRSEAEKAYTPVQKAGGTVQPHLKDFVEQMRKQPGRRHSGSLYDDLPPAGP